MQVYWLTDKLWRQRTLLAVCDFGSMLFYRHVCAKCIFNFTAMLDSPLCSLVVRPDTVSSEGPSSRDQSVEVHAEPLHPASQGLHCNGSVVAEYTCGRHCASAGWVASRARTRTVWRCTSPPSRADSFARYRSAAARRSPSTDCCRLFLIVTPPPQVPGSSSGTAATTAPLLLLLMLTAAHPGMVQFPSVFFFLFFPHPLLHARQSVAARQTRYRGTTQQVTPRCLHCQVRSLL